MAEEIGYPFLIVRDWEDNPVLDDDDTPLLWDLPKGWDIAFGKMMWWDIYNELLKFDYVDKWRIIGIKEKFGELRIDLH